MRAVTSASGSAWCLEAARETWLLVVDGNARLTTFDIGQGEAIFAQHDRVEILAGQNGVTCLVAYTGGKGPAPQLLQPIIDKISEHSTQYSPGRVQPHSIGSSP